jgi:hypothetical protein
MDGNFIFEMENFIPKELCDDIIQRFENEPKKEQSKILDTNNRIVLDLERRNSIHIYMRNMKDCKHIENELDSKTKDAINVYKREFCNYFKKYNENPEFIKQTSFKYRPIKRTTDFDVHRVTPESQQRWHSDEGEGYAHTGIIYLNNLDIKDGGVTEFASGRKVQPKAGKLLLFPGGWSNIHRGSFVHKHKYMIIFCTQFVIPKTWSPFIISQE